MKAKIRFTEYGTWILINFIFCILPLIISAYFVHSIDDTIISSFISFIYTTLICSIYAYLNSGIQNKLIFCLALLFLLFFLTIYTIYPEKLSRDTYSYIQVNASKVCLITLLAVMAISLILNYRNLEEVVERRVSEKIQKNASKIGRDVSGMLQQLKKEKP